jgi:hypothetical protein
MNIVLVTNLSPSEVRTITSRELFALSKLMKGK